MSLIKWICNVVKWRKRAFIALFINTFIVILFYYLLFENSEIIYPTILSLSLIFIYFIVEANNYYRFKNKLEEVKRSPDYKCKDLDFSEKEIIENIKEIHKDYLEKIYTLENKFKERDMLFSNWIHNMKTSVAVIDLASEKIILNKEETEEILDIQIENNILKKELEEGLNLLRIEEFSKDYVTKKHNLKSLIIEVINKNKREFIYGDIFPLVNIREDIFIYTDKKWFSYILEQIISNGIKYSKKGDKLKFEASYENKKISLLIIDNGIGIRKEELKRIFEPFYTGTNGRKDKNSTGIGLYMVKKVSEKLNHEVTINSDVEVGTTVKIEI